MRPSPKYPRPGLMSEHRQTSPQAGRLICRRLLSSLSLFRFFGFLFFFVGLCSRLILFCLVCCWLVFWLRRARGVLCLISLRCPGGLSPLGLGRCLRTLFGFALLALATQREPQTEKRHNSKLRHFSCLQCVVFTTQRVGRESATIKATNVPHGHQRSPDVNIDGEPAQFG